MNLKLLSGIEFTVIGLICLVSCVNGLICLSCNSAINITDCLGQKISCDTDEKCFLDKIILADLSTVFSGGCRSKQVCNLISSAVGKRDTVACSMCCNSPPNSTHIPCNGYLCNQAPQHAQVGGSSCGVCDRVSDPKDCAIEQQCQPNETKPATTLLFVDEDSNTRCHYLK
ncbi:uncharacterized protein LOC134698111 [Mytilus trossulus]|uniref:uncharacterized protein LOC134698111 n=1 Tax=Mytilus trossulus TaxID=6551 RepID=UPI003004782A